MNHLFEKYLDWDNIRIEFYSKENCTLFNEILLEPTNVVLNSLPTTPTTVEAAAGDCVGLGRKTTVLVFGLPIWLKDWRLIGVDTFRSY